MKRTKLFLLVAAVFSILLCTALNASALTEGDWEFELLNNEVTITGYVGSGGDVLIPETLYGCPVTTIGQLRQPVFGENVVSVTFPKTVKVIYNAFGFAHDINTTLKTIILSEGLQTLEIEAFTGLKELEEISIPSTVTSIGVRCFYNCSNLKRVSIGENSQLTDIGNEAFEYCSFLEQVNLPDSLQRIGKFAFYGTKLKNVDVPELESMGEAAFAECKQLESVTVNNINVLPKRAFEECVLLEKVSLPATLTEIGECAFSGCKNLKNIILPVSIKNIYQFAFNNCDSLKEVVIPYGTTRVSWEVFSQCDNLKSLYVPDTVTSIDAGIIKNSKNCILYCSTGSTAESVCKSGKISYLTDNSVNTGIHVYYNGTRVSFHAYGQNPELLQSRTLVPLRSIFEAMGAQVEWDAATSTAVARRGKVEVKIQIGASEMQKNGAAVALDVPAQLLNDRTMVPVRVIAEAFGADVSWNGNGRAVLINE